MFRFRRCTRWLVLVSSAAILPAFLLQCDKAALNLQRGFYTGLGNQFAAMVADAIQPAQ